MAGKKIIISNKIDETHLKIDETHFKIDEIHFKIGKILTIMHRIVKKST
jgi:uncharacterized protein YlzI (FlbEa/FlbD family)